MSGINNSNDKTQIASLESSVRSSQPKSKLNLVGKKISGRYLVEELIGQGGMCYIYRARDLFLESPTSPEVHVALKVLLEEFSQSEEAITLLKDETTKTQQLSHPNIVKVFSASFDGDLHYVTMELVDGETLEQIIKRNKPSGMPFKKAHVILQQLADALIYAHSRNVIHNDLKPSNIIFDSNGRLKVLDFGIAKHKTIEDAYAFNNSKNVAAVGGYTPTYASPEQLQGADASVKDDIFSYACIAYELLSSKHPFDRVAADKLAKETTAKRPSNCPLWLWGRLQKAMSLDATKRLGSLQAVSTKLTSNFKPAIAASVCVVAITVFISQFYASNSTQIKQLEAKLENANAINQQVATWMSWHGPEVLAKLAEIPPQYDVLKQGLLRVNQASILQDFNAKANQLNNQSSKFKDFDGTIGLYSDALEYYPDSEKLTVQLESILRERQSIIFDITSRIDLLLEQSRYDELENNNIIKLIDDLKDVDSNYVYQPNEIHINNFKIALEQSIENDNVVAQKVLLDVGKAIFTAEQKSELQFNELLKRESAIEVLSLYQQKLNLGEQATFPTKDAIVFYQPRFDRYFEKLAAIENYQELLAFEELVNSESTDLPNDFTLLVAFKEELSKRYITMANGLLKQKMYKTAEKLVERSEEITRLLDSLL
ncbi:serine/threonine-protein kinase [Pseudoalteromonas prydzensis]|uniref:serine/threonine-protein kinase n=1 Tax=Pseudoalteromonas prydzensis TaxID=182141 RepID=UPI0007E50952|nr:serine/threonine-protein kinase [Pseudoalteromonas prydzensis]MBE0380045.1 hypothetical protein [Pseudoalteromonas prydzensis ACAM 620]